MRLLVTGGCGFIGSNFIINEINKYDNNICNIDSLTYASNKSNLENLEKNKYEFHECDILSRNKLKEIFFSFKPHAVIHFAAESHVDRSIDSPLDFVNTNVLGTVNLLRISQDYLGSNNSHNNFKFLHVSTDEVYGSLGDDGLFSESTPYDPSSPYSASKASADHFVNAWYRTYDFPAIISNCSNNYGPLQFPEKLIPLIVSNCLNEKELPVYGNGENVRDWLYVTDHCEALHSLYLHGEIGQSYNIGGNHEMKNIDIVEKICELMDEFKPRKNGEKYKNLIHFVADRPGHDYRYAIDSSKIFNKVSWKPQETFESGIKKTVKWYLENLEWLNTMELKNKSGS